MRPPVLIEDLSAVIDIATAASLCTAVWCVHRRDVTVSTLAHVLTLTLLAACLGHYTEQHLVSADTLREHLHASRQVNSMALATTLCATHRDCADEFSRCVLPLQHLGSYLLGCASL